ncbi:uncharacterized protein FIBRA_03111 [Fibroporia radiculosa]|uniref:Heterokaryon incompatibility domain-containing protein n=1 Tax=Fibroporia radiculosa TaxID=599839 RepID=J4G474_9APHY|nr:uncharacterized protein FIBRA_03111 [Fibroporia radiculosa]CCM01063.1 predicted protein [Fibroporia radiculosa]
MPIRLMKLPEMKLVERGAIVDYLSEKLEKARQKPAEIFGCLKWNEPWLEVSENSREKTLQLALNEWIKKATRFAILSHTWEKEEVTYNDFTENRHFNKAGNTKLKQFCRVAYQKYGIEFAWADTVCIDKSSSAELDESIRSMFAWYRNSAVCIAYLAESMTIGDMEHDRWFTRGWTLQELLAPQQFKFYRKDWEPLTDLPDDKGREIGFLPSHLVQQRQQLRDTVARVTGMAYHEFTDFLPGAFGNYVAERMTWIAKRKTTRGEDKSYCMMGIFGVSIYIAYGEGSQSAFFRLFKAILDVTNNPLLFRWIGLATNAHPSRLIPSSAECYPPFVPTNDLISPFEGEPVTLTSAGMRIELLIVPVKTRLCEDPDQQWTHQFDCCLSEAPIRASIIRTNFVFNNSFGLPPSGGRFAFGIPFDNHSIHPLSKEPWALLLFKPAWESNPIWEKIMTKDILLFECMERFREMDVHALKGVEIAREIWGRELEEEAPTITLETPYL